MAGGKETPRQKMIGMMYLVLTALLALQVSSAIMMKFKFLDDSLMGVNKKTDVNNTGVVTGIRDAVSKAGNAKEDVRVVDDAQKVRERTKELIKYLNGQRDELIKVTGGVDETGMYKGAKEEELVAIHMIKGKRKGEEIEKKLNEYATFIRQYEPNAPAKLAMSGKEDPLAMRDPEQKRKTFSELNFAQTPLVAALAVLAQKESEILKYEADALSKLAQKVGAEQVRFDNIFAMASAESQTVAAGTKYKAEMFLAASSKSITPTMTFEGRAIKVENGVGKVEFPVTAGAYDKEGIAKKTWKGTITMRKPNGKDTTFVINKEYKVAKPVIQVQSASVQALFLNCGNKLNIQVPALGSEYKPSFSASGAQVIPGAKTGEVTIVPTAKEVKINVSSGGNLIGSETFKVKLIPKPDIVVTSNGREVNTKQGMPSPGPREITIKAVPDQSFKDFLPEDARYRVTKFQVILVRGKRPVQQQVVNNQSVNLNSYAAQARPEDRYYIEVQEVKRLNFRGVAENVNIGNVGINIPLN